MKILVRIICLLITFHVSNPVLAKPEINIAMTATFVSTDGIKVYEEICRYIAKKLDIEVNFVFGLSYSVVSGMLEQGIVQMAFVSGYPYILNIVDKKNSTKLLAAPVMTSPLYKSQPIYYSYIVVHKDSLFSSFDDLKDKIWVYNDKTSNSGYNMPRAKLISMGKTNGYFSQVIKSGSHEESIRMVAKGQAHAAAVDSLVLDFMRSKHEKYANEVRIIELLGPAGIPPIVYSSSLDEKLASDIRNVLTGMAQDNEGKKILSKAYLQKFVDVNDELYSDLYKWHEMAVHNNYLTIK